MSDKEQGPEKLFVVVGPWGITPFLDPDAAARYPGPRMYECADRKIVRYIRADLAQPVVDPQREQRIAKIRLRQVSRGNANDKWYVDDIDYLLSCIQPAIDPNEQRCDVSVTGKHRVDAPYCKDCGKSFPLAQPAGELTVEQVRDELKSEFPDVEIQQTANTRGVSWRIWLGMRGGNIYGPTLSDCMSQVRAWAHSQTVEKGS